MLAIVVRASRHALSVCTFAALAVASFVASPAQASDGERPSVPTTPRPNARRVGCSATEPVCVHVVQTTKRTLEAAASALRQGERTLAALRRLGAPQPLPDDARGGGPEFDLYVDDASAGARAYDDPASSVGAYDLASGFAVVPGALSGCELDSAVARTIGAAALLGLDPGAHASTLALGGSQVARVTAPCAHVEAAALDRYQRAPELGVTRARPDTFAGEALWLDYLDETYGFGLPVVLFSELVALTGQKTPVDAFAWRAEPDVYDVLRRVFLGRGTSLDEAWLGFAIARAFIGSRSDGAHLTDTERFDDLGRVRFDWVVPLATLPRRLRTRAIDATGASYTWLDTSGAADSDHLTVLVECERSFAFRWALVTVDTEGKELGRHVAGRFGEETTSLSLASLEGVGGVLVVGAAVGHDDREHPFDPEEFEPTSAACEITLHKQ